MKKVSIIKNNQITNQAEFANDELLNEWLNRETLNGSFGKPAHDVVIEPEKRIEHPEIPAVIDEQGNIVTEAIPAWVEIIPAVIQHIESEFTYEIEDITAQYNIEQNKMRLINKGDSFAKACQNCLSIIGGYNDDRGLTVEQITQMATTFAQIESTLNRRMPKTSKVLINAIVPDGAIVTQELKDLLLDELREY